MRVTLTALALAGMLLLSGCSATLLPYAREMGDMALLRTMGVDREGDGVSLTVSTGPRARGLQGDREAALTLSARGDSLSAAALSLQGLSDSYVFFGYVDQLLLGEELAREDVRPVLDWFARDWELGLVLGCAALIYHLAGLETFGVPYLAPFTTGTQVRRGHPTIFRLPLPRMKWRDGAVRTQNRRNQA